MNHYDLCVVGAGSAGVAAAEAARGLDKSVVLISGPGALGGLCILRGCMPAKTLLSSTERLDDVRTAPELGIKQAAPKIDLAAVVARKRELVDYFAEDRVDEIRSFPLLRGAARFTAPDSIEVAGERVTARRFIIATGSIIDASTISCLARDDYFTSDDALEMTSAPKRLIVIGGGPVGCEFAQYFARVGSVVTLLQEAPELLQKEDADIGAAVREALESEGVAVMCGATVAGCSRSGDERRITVRMPNGESEIVADGVMLASGRVPNVATLQLETAGVARTPEGGIGVDPYLATSNPNVYAAGDVLGRRCLVHVASYAGNLAARNALGVEPRTADFDRFEAHAVYVQPQVAVVGLLEREATERGLRVRVRKHPFHEVGKAVVSGAPRGFVKMLAADDDRILGIAIVGDDAVELAGEAILAIDRRMTLGEMIDVPHLHPTMSEIFARVAEDF